MKSKRFAMYSILGGLSLAAAITLPSMITFAEERYTELQNFTKVLNLVQQYYVEEVDTKKLIQGAIRGMLRELDPHTNYMTPEIYKDFESETAGEFGGLGIEISIQNGVLTIISPIEDTPAWQAGIQPGDKVIAVNGKSTKGLSLVEASQLFKGKRGDKTVLTVVRGDDDKPMDITVVRGQVKLKSVKSIDLEEGYLYVRVTSFIDNTSRDVQKALEDFKKKNSDIKGIVLDLRKNPGGLLDQAIKVSDFFLKEGTIVSTIGRDKSKKESSFATAGNDYLDFPLIVLLNESSASASEIVAGALQDNNRAVVMGSRSFGKGSVQSVVKLGDGSGLKLTIARYYTPSGRSIQSEGIEPDISIEEVNFDAFKKAIIAPTVNREKDMDHHLLSESEKKQAANGTVSIETWWKDYGKGQKGNQSPKEKLFSSDYQAYQAFNYLKAWKLFKKIK